MGVKQAKAYSSANKKRFFSPPTNCLLARMWQLHLDLKKCSIQVLKMTFIKELHNFSFSFVLDVLLMLNTVGCLACCWIGLVKTGSETANSQNYKQILANLRSIRQNKFNTRSYWFGLVSNCCFAKAKQFCF